MAERRMFAMTIIDSDSFLDMPLSTQALYFHLSMRADDDGFINNPKKIQRIIGCTDDDFKLLITKRFIITFESGVIVIKHWKIHNYIQKDRYKPTLYQKEKKLLAEKENGSYTDCIAGGYSLDTVCIQDVYSLDTQVSIGKNSEELEIEKEEDDTSDKPKRTRFVSPTLEEVKAYCKERNNTVDAEHFINYYTSNGWQVGRNKMKDWKAAIRTWEKNGYSKPKEEAKEDTSKWAGTVY